jgi:hypothetical protein
MSGISATSLRTLAFGDLEAGIWGAAAAGTEALVAVAATDGGAPISAVGATLTAGPDDAWELTGPGLALLLEAEDPARDTSAESRLAQVCRVTGTVTLDGTPRDIGCLGLRSAVDGVDLSSLDSVRQVLTWFGEDDGIVLSSLRPRGAKGHERDDVTATVLEPDGPVDVSEGRMSTTYKAGGLPSRVGLELWLTDEDQQFPRRVAGEALGVDASGVTAAATVSLHAFRCHSRGRDGAAAYVIARPR